MQRKQNNFLDLVRFLKYLYAVLNAFKCTLKELISLAKEQSTFFLCAETQFTCQVTSAVYIEQTSNYFYYKY